MALKMLESKKLPMTVLGGFLGSGKTSLLNHILRSPHGMRILVMVNDFGSLNVDASLIESTNETEGVINLTNGCVCCSMGSELVRALLHIEAMVPELDWLIIEGSGVSDPKSIARIGQAGGAFELRSIVTLADVSTIQKMAKDRYVGDVVMQQLTSADLILLNKTDLVDDSQRHSVMDWLREKAPTTPLLESVHAEIAWQHILNTAQPGQVAGSDTSEDRFRLLHGFNDEETHSARNFSTLTVTQSAAYDEEKLRAILDNLPDEVFRIKGLVYVGDEAALTWLQYSPNKKHELVASSGDDAELAGNVIVIASKAMSTEPLEQLFRSAEL